MLALCRRQINNTCTTNSSDRRSTAWIVVDSPIRCVNSALGLHFARAKNHINPLRDPIVLIQLVVVAFMKLNVSFIYIAQEELVQRSQRCKVGHLAHFTTCKMRRLQLSAAGQWLKKWKFNPKSHVSTYRRHWFSAVASNFVPVDVVDHQSKLET